jgi:hypothetical protein
MQRMRIRIAAFLLLLLLTSLGVARADELSDLNDLILNDPQNVELNLRYARLAEQKGDLRKALAAFERVTVNSPLNKEAQEGFRRVSRKLQPDVTRVTLEFGGGWESNPSRLASGGKSDALALGRAEVKDERRIGDVPWRTVGNATGEFYRSQGSDLNYASLGMLTGPMTDLTPQFALHTGIGPGIASFGEHLLYNEAVAGFTLESGFWKGAQTGRLRLGFRRYGEFFGGSDGVYADLSERFGFVSVLEPNDIVVAMPWFRWSGIEGTPLHVPLEETQPGRYWEAGLRGEYFKPMADWLIVGGALSIGYRRYSDVTILDDGTPVIRRDWTFIPSLTAIFPKAFHQATDLRIDYKYENNRSNVNFDTYTDHQITTSVIVRF